MSGKARELTRLELKKIIDRAMGASRTVHWTLAARQAQSGIGNKHMLPMRVLGISAPAPPGAGQPLQAVSGAFAFLPGYSAEAGSDEAAADATGRGGDTLILARASASGGSRGAAAGVTVFPGSGDGSGGSTGTAIATIV